MNLRRLFFPASLALLGYACWAGSGGSQSQPRVNFGRDVRPILSDRCFKCHGPDVASAASGLRLDSFANATAKLGDGAAIVPGDPGKSLLIRRVSAADPGMRMPPVGSPLTPEQIATLRAWISEGARYAKHWAFVPPKLPLLPAVSDPKWAKNSIDRFVMAKLDSAHLKPEPEADRDTLALRAAQTLTGLPPTPALLASFRNDARPDAYERLVDRLLASPEYGEHEARYWLDAVRYGDTHGLQLDNERAVFPYRDWVVRAFNADLPFNKFVEWQVAGDLAPNPSTEQLIATGYVRMNLTSNEGGAIPEEFLARNTFDRVDTTSTVFLGLTAGCAKCHDHKYDPIKQKDYYGLYAYFDSTQDEPLDGNIALPPPYMPAPTPEEKSRIDELDSRLESLRQKVDPLTAAGWCDQHVPSTPETRDWQIAGPYVSTSFDAAFDAPKPGEPGQPNPTWRALGFKLGSDASGIIGKDSASVYVRGTVTVRADSKLTMNVASDDAIKLWLNGRLIHAHKINRGLKDSSDVVVAEFREGDNELIAKVVNGAGPDGLRISFGSANDEAIKKAAAGYRAMPSSSDAAREVRSTYLSFGPESPSATSYRAAVKERAQLEASIPMTLIAREMPQPRPTFILKRGLYDQKGDAVTRHIPAAVGQLPTGVPNNRLGFAKWLTDPANPLVARVFVNRIWQQHFGVGIVKTVEDFGSQGEWPLNQPLLDYLAVTFVQKGWSVKDLNRMIVTSAAFRQSSRISPSKLSKDPENRLISRGPRFRLDAEVIRDKALAAGGLLVEQLGGHGFKPYQPDGLWEGSSDPASSTHFYVRDRDKSIYRRSMYLFWKRTSPPPVMVTFDSPLRDTCIVRRSTTNTPLQALAALNEPAFLEASRTMAARIMAGASGDDSRLRLAYNLAFSRPPRPQEVALLKRSLARYRQIYRSNVNAAKTLLNVGDSIQSPSLAPAEQASWMIVCSSLMNTNEFLTQH